MAGSQRTVLFARFISQKVQRTGLLLALFGVVACTPSPTPCSAQEAEPETSRRLTASSFLCEASALAPSPWGEGRVLVADNEEHGVLAEMGLQDGWLELEGRAFMPEKRRPRDIEALAVSRETVWVVGSHSVNKTCKVKKKRARIRVLALSPDTSKRRGDDPAAPLGELSEVAFYDNADALAGALADLEACTRFFGGDVGARLCGELHKGERDACRSINIEGAVFTEHDGESALWVGLREPLVDGKAVMLRAVVEDDVMRFAGGILVDLDGRGIRELALHASDLYIISGPVADSTRPFGLWVLPAASLNLEEALSPVYLAKLPTSAEGLVVGERYATFVIDGEQGDAHSCARHAEQGRLRLHD